MTYIATSHHGALEMLFGSIRVIHLYILSSVDTHTAWINTNPPTSLKDLPGPGFNVLRTLFAFIAIFLFNSVLLLS